MCPGPEFQACEFSENLLGPDRALLLCGTCTLCFPLAPYLWLHFLRVGQALASGQIQEGASGSSRPQQIPG